MGNLYVLVARGKSKSMVRVYKRNRAVIGQSMSRTIHTGFSQTKDCYCPLFTLDLTIPLLQMFELRPGLDYPVNPLSVWYFSISSKGALIRSFRLLLDLWILARSFEF